MEDAFVVAESVQHAREVGKPLSYALRLYDETRSPHYLGLYREIERAGKQVKAANAERVLGFDDAVDAKVSAFVGDTAWIYAYVFSQAQLVPFGTKDLACFQLRREKGVGANAGTRAPVRGCNEWGY